MIPTKYLEKDYKIFSAKGERLKIIYKRHKEHICNDEIYLINDFVITKDINEEIILGLPFISQIKPYTSELDDIHTTIFRKKIIFPYLNSLSKEESNLIKNKIFFKINLISQQINYLKYKIKIKIIESSLKTHR